MIVSTIMTSYSLAFEWFVFFKPNWGSNLIPSGSSLVDIVPCQHELCVRGVLIFECQLTVLLSVLQSIPLLLELLSLLPQLVDLASGAKKVKRRKGLSKGGGFFYQ